MASVTRRLTQRKKHKTILPMWLIFCEFSSSIIVSKDNTKENINDCKN